MANTPTSLDVEVHTIHTESRSPAAIIVKGVAPSDHTNRLLQELGERVGCVVFALDRGVTFDALNDDDLARVGLQRIPNAKEV